MSRSVAPKARSGGCPMTRRGAAGAWAASRIDVVVLDDAPAGSEALRQAAAARGRPCSVSASARAMSRATSGLASTSCRPSASARAASAGLT